MDRTLKFALASLVFNIAFAIYHLTMGLVTSSWWLLTLGSYYLVLSMLVSVRGMTEAEIVIMNATLGSAVCVIVFLLGLNLIRNKKILFKSIDQ